MEATKEKPTFTPGPWEVYSCEEGERHGQVFAPDGISDGKTVCDLPKSKLIQPEDKRKNHYFVHSAEDEANARLIAAAPTMYEVLQELAESMELAKNYGYEKEHAMIQEVLAKVEGGEG